MTKNQDEKEQKFGIYMSYGMAFGLLFGALVSIIGAAINNSFLQISGYGFGLAAGLVVGSFVYLLQESKDKDE